MYKLVILIESPPDLLEFEENWPAFLHQAEKMPGLIREATVRVSKILFGNPQIHMLHELFFETLADLQTAMGSPYGQASGQIIQKITGGRMTLLIAEHREDMLENIRRYSLEKPFLTPSDLEAFMAENAIPGEIVYLEVPTPTVEAAAQAVGTSPDQIVKSVLFTIGEKRVLAIASGLTLIEQRAIASHYGVGRKRVKLATPEIVLDVTGYPVGTVPPFGHLNNVHTLIDPQVLAMSEIYAGGGAHNALVRLYPGDILRGSEAEIIDLHNRPGDTA